MKSIITILLLAAFSTGAADQSDISPYISVRGGGAWMGEISFEEDITGARGSISVEPGYVAEVAAGTTLAPLPVRIEAAYFYQRSEIKDDITFTGMPAIEVDGKGEISAMMANAYLDLLPDVEPYVVPHFMIGIGGANVDFDGEDDTLFAWQIGGGAGVYLSDMVVVDVTYRYFSTRTYRVSYTGFDVEADVDSHQVLVGIRLHF